MQSKTGARKARNEATPACDSQHWVYDHSVVITEQRAGVLRSHNYVTLLETANLHTRQNVVYVVMLNFMVKPAQLSVLLPTIFCNVIGIV